jgi:hypothetical protein
MHAAGLANRRPGSMLTDCRRLTNIKLEFVQGWLSKPEITPFEPDLGHTSEGKRIRVGCRKWGDSRPFLFRSGLFVLEKAYV